MKAMAPFHAKAKLKQIALAKILMPQILIQKQSPPNRQIGLPLCQDDHHLSDVINFDYVSPLPPP